MASCDPDRAENGTDEILERPRGSGQQRSSLPDEPGDQHAHQGGQRNSAGESHVATTKPAERAMHRGKTRGNQSDDPYVAKIVSLREQRDRMKQEAKKLSSEVRLENRKRVRLGRLAEKLSNNDLCNLMQQRGLESNASGSQTTSRPEATTP